MYLQDVHYVNTYIQHMQTSAMPAAIAMTFLTAPPISTPTTSFDVNTLNTSVPNNSATWCVCVCVREWEERQDVDVKTLKISRIITRVLVKTRDMQRHATLLHHKTRDSCIITLFWRRPQQTVIQAQQTVTEAQQSVIQQSRHMHVTVCLWFYAHGYSCTWILLYTYAHDPLHMHMTLSIYIWPCAYAYDYDCMHVPLSICKCILLSRQGRGDRDDRHDMHVVMHQRRQARHAQGTTWQRRQARHAQDVEVLTIPSTSRAPQSQEVEKLGI